MATVKTEPGRLLDLSIIYNVSVLSPSSLFVHACVQLANACCVYSDNSNAKEEITSLPEQSRYYIYDV